ncbi:hypothetical protein C8J57DRAFT_1528779 [Mycena rebaudengoi]|nr:hypothetical protein C8J57DRAFT_1528779 [Mycena rebaudengoi]
MLGEGVCANAPAEAKKRGNQGDFHGKREEFLNSWLERYCDASAKKNTPEIWPKMLHEYWQKFPWCLPIMEEPLDDFTPDAMPDAELSKEDREKKAEVLTKTKDIGANDRACKAKGLTHLWNLFMAMLARLEGGEGQAPRRLAAYQVYMHSERHKAKVQDVLALCHPDKLNAQNTVNLRCAVARSLLEEEPDEVKEEEGEGVVMPGDRKRARLLLSAMMSALLEELHALTGYHLTLLAGCVDGEKFDVRM